MQIYILFNSISVILGRWKVDNDRLCAMKLRLRLRRFRLESDRTRSARPVATELPGLPSSKHYAVLKRIIRFKRTLQN